MAATDVIAVAQLLICVILDSLLPESKLPAQMAGSNPIDAENCDAQDLKMGGADALTIATGRYRRSPHKQHSTGTQLNPYSDTDHSCDSKQTQTCNLNDITYWKRSSRHA
jgi:hypothetical protein